MSTPLQPTPHELRVRARTKQYENRLVEESTIKEIDALVFGKIREYEAQLVADAEEFLAANAVDMQAADAIEKSLRNDVRYPLEEGAAPTPDLAAAYEALRRHAETAIRELELAEQSAEWWSSRASDPYQSYSAMLDKYRLIRPRFDIDL